MHRLAILGAIFVFLQAGSALAEDADTIDCVVESTACGDTDEDWRAQRLNLSMALQLDSTMSEDANCNYYDIGLTGRLRATFFDRLTIDLALGVIHHEIHLFEPEGAALNAELEVPWRGIVGGGARMVLYRWPHWDISLFSEIYFPIGSGEANLQSAEFFDEMSLLGLMDIEDIRSWVDVRHRWYRAEFGVTVRGFIGRWRPFIDIKYVHMPGRLELNLDPTLQSFVDLLAPELNGSFDASFMYPYYAIGFEVELGYGFEIELRVAATPTLDGGWVFVGRMVLEIPLTAQARHNWIDPPEIGRR